MNDAMMEVYQAGLERTKQRTVQLGEMTVKQYETFIFSIGETDEAYAEVKHDGVVEKVFQFAFRRNDGGSVSVEQPNAYKMSDETVQFLKRAAREAKSKDENNG